MSKSKKKSTGFQHSKKLGQNFLTDHGVVEDIAIGSLADEDTLVIEIGPGQGVLTDELMNYAGALIAVELDDRLIPYLRTRFALNDRVEIVHGDILEIDLGNQTDTCRYCGRRKEKTKGAGKAEKTIEGRSIR